MKVFLTMLLTWILVFDVRAQGDFRKEISKMTLEAEGKQQELATLRNKIDSLKLLDIAERLEDMQWPGDEGELVKHSAMVLGYAEDHEMAAWVAHIILTDVAEGRTTRTNDFRLDEKVSTGTAEEADYFLKSETKPGVWEYDGFGYDRGHLAPSADFRWSQKALSESYYYSNMTPQHPDFNRGTWAELEAYMRGYVIENETDVFVVTGPVLNEDLSKIERSVNGLSLPKHHFKVVLDPSNGKSLGFLMPNESCEGPMEAYALSVNEIEKLTGLDFFKGMPDEIEEDIESQTDYRPWLPKEQRDDVAILPPAQLGKGRYNTLQAYDFVDTKKKVEVCGTVVSTFKSKKNNVFVNLDKKFPNTLFTATIWARDLVNFSYPPDTDLMGKKICVKGQVTRRDKVMQMNVAHEKQVVILDEEF